MIKVKHPLDACNRSQEKFVSDSPIAERLFHELLFSYGNASYRYYSISRKINPSIEDYEEWLSGLDPVISVAMEEKGYEGCLTVLSFTRYVNEKNDIGMDEYVEGLMGEDDFANYLKIVLNRKASKASN